MQDEEKSRHSAKRNAFCPADRWDRLSRWARPSFRFFWVLRQRQEFRLGLKLKLPLAQNNSAAPEAHPGVLVLKSPRGTLVAFRHPVRLHFDPGRLLRGSLASNVHTQGPSLQNQDHVGSGRESR